MGTSPFRRLVWLTAGIGLLFVLGMIGYVILEGWNLIDASYMSMITLSTVGYGEPYELSPAGRVFTCALIGLCLLGMSLWTASLTGYLIDADLREKFIKRRIERMLDSISGHTIVCGATLLGVALIERLCDIGSTVALIDPDADRVRSLRERNPKLLTLAGNPTDELMLADANVLSAGSVVAATPSEMDNLLIAITCKDLRTHMTVIAECNDMTIANRMRKAGVDEIISPARLGGLRAAELITGDDDGTQAADLKHASPVF